MGDGWEEICFFANLCESSLFALFIISALFVLGVNCGDNTFLYPILRGISSSSYLWNAVDRSLIPDLLGKLFFSLWVPFLWFSLLLKWMGSLDLPDRRDRVRWWMERSQFKALILFFDRGCGMPDQSYVPCPADGVHDYRRSRSLSSEESTSATSPSNAFMRAGHIDGNKSSRYSTKGKQHRLGGESCRWAGRIGGYRPWYRILVRRERNCMHEKPSIP